jgi:hypothetical protein
MVCVAWLCWLGQRDLRGFRSYWSDTTELMSYLSERVEEGDLLLMEQGAIARYYLIARGMAGHRPADVADTWWYQDDQGSGQPAFERAIAQKRFAFIIFDYTVTKDSDHQLLEAMDGRYARDATFPARIFGDQGTIEVFRPLP